MKLRSFSKINLSLRVLKKMSSGLHDIQSNSILIDLHDQIKINRSYKNKNEIFFKGDFARFVNKKDNSIKSIVKYLEKEKIFKSNYKFTITKNIPVFSGLGGGTSNAVTIFRHFQKKACRWEGIFHYLLPKKMKIKKISQRFNDFQHKES